MPAPGGDAGGPLLVDAHVHLHGAFRLPAFLDAADSNFRTAASALGVPVAAPGCLLLADAGDDGLVRTRHELARYAPGWALRETAEPCSAILERGGKPRLVLISGRQIATAEGLEVLALLTEERFPGLLPLHDTLDLVRESGALAVIPWGFGKWTLGRGRLLADTLRRAAGPLFLADSGCRPRSVREPRLLRHARRTGLPVLPGSDPLPFPDHEKRAGSCGFVASASLDARRPASRLHQWLVALADQPPVYGSRRSPVGFVRDQIRMQVVKRRTQPSPPSPRPPA